MVATLKLEKVEKAIRSMAEHPKPLPLFCGVQFYAWGDPEFIPNLLGISNQEKKPYAELWIGAHPDLPAEAVIDDVRVGLDILLVEIPEILLGSRAFAEYEGRLPFLMKILAAARPLSIQVHPNCQQAREGYEREDRLGVPLDSPQRNYRDRNHKPELLCALTPFYALKGFRPEVEIEEVLVSIPEWQELLDDFRQRGLRDLYHHMMTMPQPMVDGYLTPLLERLRHHGGFAKDQREYWLLRADELYSQEGQCDRGLFSLLLLNFLCLKPGEAIFQEAGELHAYLEGVGVEIMANSNNVLRGGLTPKHVDVPALLEIVRFEGRQSSVLLPEQSGREAIYEVPVEEFLLSRIEVGENVSFLSCGPLRLGIVLEGELEVHWSGQGMTLRRGQSYLIPHDCECRFQSARGAVVYQGACRY